MHIYLTTISSNAHYAHSGINLFYCKCEISEQCRPIRESIKGGVSLESVLFTYIKAHYMYL